MTDPTGDAAVTKARGRQLFYVLLIIALLIFIAGQLRAAYRSGQRAAGRDRAAAMDSADARTVRAAGPAPAPLAPAAGTPPR
jgi:hypothetical protein